MNGTIVDAERGVRPCNVLWWCSANLWRKEKKRETRTGPEQILIGTAGHRSHRQRGNEFLPKKVRERISRRDLLRCRAGTVVDDVHPSKRLCEAQAKPNRSLKNILKSVCHGKSHYQCMTCAISTPSSPLRCITRSVSVFLGGMQVACVRYAVHTLCGDAIGCTARFFFDDEQSMTRL